MAFFTVGSNSKECQSEHGVSRSLVAILTVHSGRKSEPA